MGLNTHCQKGCKSVFRLRETTQKTGTERARAQTEVKLPTSQLMVASTCSCFCSEIHCCGFRWMESGFSPHVHTTTNATPTKHTCPYKINELKQSGAQTVSTCVCMSTMERSWVTMHINQHENTGVNNTNQLSIWICFINSTLINLHNANGWNSFYLLSTAAN